MRNIKKILIEERTGKKYYVKDLAEDFHTSAGIISKNDLKKNKAVSSKGKHFTILTPTFVDFWENLQRGPQVMIQKDIGLILARTGVNSGSKIVDAGGGSGSLCLSLANVCKEVTVYEIHPEHYDIIQKNVKNIGFKNLILKQDNIYNGIAEKELDLITLDLPEPWQVTEHAEKALKEGGFLVVYLPNLGQVKLFLDSTRRTGITVLETVELIERKWKIEDNIMRPEFQMLGHTGFLTFCRKL
ncbi:tRNA methyltransferase [Candidatus Woesearchaeota archaeon CG10_big_fil_rev_8_21_14_0_10_45_16]|nr:MAG: tRNA methyltransferase [Candidatus Woesearchaeota archaeon CG10_big_fil_rev_8_21_14_0_10_45_16]